jgi:hypothetical protein
MKLAIMMATPPISQEPSLTRPLVAYFLESPNVGVEDK